MSATEMNWIYHSFLVSALSDITRLEFVSLTGAMDGAAGFDTFYGPALDDVVVTAVPVPAAVWLFGSGRLGLIGFARKKK